MKKAQKLNLRSGAQGKSDEVEEDETRQGEIALFKGVQAKEFKEIKEVP